MNLRTLRTAIILQCLLLLSLSSFAEKFIYFDFEQPPMYKANATFKYIKVIDNRQHRDDLGILRFGAFEKKKAVITKQKFTATLSTFANNVASEAVIQRSDTLLIVMYDFMFDEFPAESKIATFYFKAQFFTGGNDKYTLVADMDTIYETKENDAVLLRIPSIVLLKTLDSLAASNDNITHDSRYSFTSACNKVTKEKTFPIYQCNGTFKKGIYYTYEDFLNHQPSDVPFIQHNHYIDNRVNKPTFYYKNEKGKKGATIDSVFAIYNGENWYQPNKQGWSKMEYENGDFYRKQRFPGLRNNSNEVATMSVFGGLIGGLITAAVMEDMKGTGVFKARLIPTQQVFKPVKRIF